MIFHFPLKTNSNQIKSNKINKIKKTWFKYKKYLCLKIIKIKKSII